METDIERGWSAAVGAIAVRIEDGTDGAATFVNNSGVPVARIAEALLAIAAEAVKAFSTTTGVPIPAILESLRES